MSPKNKGKFGKGKPAVEVQDEFVSGVNRFLHALKPYTLRLAFVAAGVIVAIIGYQAWRWNAERKQAKASALLDDALAISRRAIEPPEAEPAPKPGEPAPAEPEGDDDTETKDITYPSLEARAEAALVPLATLQSDYGSTEVAKQARLFEAGLLLDAERYDDALRLYRALAENGPASQRVVAREGVGYALEAKALAAADPKAREAGLGEALAAFEAVQPDKEGPHRDYALFHQARILAKQGQRDKAVTLYKEVLDGDPNPSLRRDVRNRMAALGAPLDD